MTSLSAIGMPRRRLVAASQVAVELRVALGDRLQVRGVELRGGHLAALDERDRVLGGESERVDHAVGGTRKRSPSRSGAFAKTSSRRATARLVLVPDVHEVERMRRRRNVGEIELGDDADGVEDRAELLRETLDLLVGQREPREPRDVEHFVFDIAIGQILSKRRAPCREPAARRYEFGQLAAATTFAAWAPLGPWTTSNSTRWPSVRVLKPSIAIAEKWTKTSSPPSRSMKP
jgi:hypothetical protein